MPAKKITWAQLRVGLMAVAAFVIVAVLIFLLSGSRPVFASYAVIYTYLDDAAALATGAPVRLNGVLVGKVRAVGLSGERDPQRIIRVEMDVEEDRLNQIPVDSMVAISAENVLGSRFLNIKMGKSSEMIKPQGTLPALDTREFEEVVQQSYSLLSSLQGILKRVDAIVGVVEAGKGSIGKLIVDEELYNRLNAILAEGQKITAAMSSPKGTIGKLLYDDAVHKSIVSSLDRVDVMLSDLQRGKGTIGKALNDDTLHNELVQTIAEVRRTVQNLNAGKGTAGKLLTDDTLHNQLNASLLKMDEIIAKINAGQGTIGQLLVNPQLYDSLNGTTRELQDLVKAIRENPTKYLRIRLSIF